LLAVEAVPNKNITFRSVATAQSLGTGQGFFKCACTKNVTQSDVFVEKKRYCATLNAIVALHVQTNK